MNWLVVARWQEDISWLDGVDGWKKLVVQKGEQLPNEGREASSFFWALHQLYDGLKRDQRVLCVQANPFDHSHDPLAEGLQEMDGFAHVGHWRIESDLQGAPHHPGLPMADMFRKWFGHEPPQSFPFCAGGQFVVDAQTIRRFPRGFYKRMVKHMNDHAEAPWVMERLWETMFRGVAHSS